MTTATNNPSAGRWKRWQSRARSASSQIADGGNSELVNSRIGEVQTSGVSHDPGDSSNNPRILLAISSFAIEVNCLKLRAMDSPGSLLTPLAVRLAPWLF